MTEGAGPQVYSIAAHRGFADALVAGLVPRYGDGAAGLSRLTLLLPSQRAIRTVTEAFVRLAGTTGSGGLLLPRMVAVGDLDLDEVLGPLFDTLGAASAIPPAADPTRRWFRLAAILAAELGDAAPPGPALLRQAWEIGRTMDRLLVEGIGPDDLLKDPVLAVVGDLSRHWHDALRTFARVQQLWLPELDARGEIDAPARRNRLFDAAAQRWAAQPPADPIVAAGVTSASPALARLLRVVAQLPRGAVILPDLDLNLDADVWDELGTAGSPQEAGDPPIGPGDAVTHPQYHLKLLLARMGLARGEVRAWHRAGMAAAPPARSRAISNLFLPPHASGRWVDLPADERRLGGVRLMESAHPEEEAQAIAILMREALEVPERRVALVTPDRALAARVIAHLGRWGIAADDTAGQPLPLTAAGRFVLQLAEVVAQRAAPVPLMALLGHPFAGQVQGRADWLDHLRALDRRLRGPRPAPGLEPLGEVVAKLAKGGGAIADWWQQIAATLAPLMDLNGPVRLDHALTLLAEAGEALAGERLWAEADGRALALLVEDLRQGSAAAQTMVEADWLPRLLRDAMERVAVRPPWGGHPRVAVYGLIEARMSRADLLICGGMTEGVWPASAAPDPLLAPAVLRALGVPGGDFRIGLAAHDLAAALGAPEVVLSHARRDAAGPVLPSRFILRFKALLGEDALPAHVDQRAVDLASKLAHPAPVEGHPQPQPCPSPAQRDVAISVTALDRLRSDPYQFYARAILGLSKLDPLDAEPSAAWKGTAVHEILRQWHDRGGALLPIAEAELAKMTAHPLVRALWWPRLREGLLWIEAMVAQQQGEGRSVIGWEVDGRMTRGGVTIHGRADRFDRMADGTLAVVDYKTGKPPSKAMVKQGYSLQLGLIALMAQHGAFPGISGAASAFEYWSLMKDKGSFGKVAGAVSDKASDSALTAAEFVPETARFLDEAITLWIKGAAPFTARPKPDLPGHTDYDQLMRLDEWLGRDLKGDAA